MSTHDSCKGYEPELAPKRGPCKHNRAWVYDKGKPGDKVFQFWHCNSCGKYGEQRYGAALPTWEGETRKKRTELIG